MKRLRLFTVVFLLTSPATPAAEPTATTQSRGVEQACIRAAELEFPRYRVDAGSAVVADEPAGTVFEGRVLVSVEAYGRRGALGVQCQFTSASSPYELSDFRCRDFACHYNSAMLGQISAALKAEGYR